MIRPLPISSNYAVSPALAADDFARVARLGFKTVISFLTEAEAELVLASRDAARAAQQAGLHFVHIPASKFDLMTDDVLDATSRELKSAEGPVLGTCTSGQRAAIIWAATKSRTTPVNDVLEALNAAGLNLSFLRDDFETQAQIGRLQQDFLDAA